MNVTITGNLGAGKTSVCNELKKMGYDVISGGDIYRTYAQEHGITIVELNEMAKMSVQRNSAQKWIIPFLIAEWHGILYRTLYISFWK